MQYQVHHGTNQVFDRFDPARLCMNNQNDASAQGFFFAGRADTAWQYAEQAARKLIPDQVGHEARVDALLKEARRAEARGNWALSEAKTLEAEELEAQAIHASPAGARVLVCMIELQDPMILNSSDVPLAEFSRMIEHARLMGHDGVIVHDHFDTPSGLTAEDTHYVVFDASRVEIMQVLLEPGLECNEAQSGCCPEPF